MALDIYQKEFERALTTLANPTLDVSVLTAAPQAGLLLYSMCILAACTMDASLENEKTKDTIRLLKTPKSFRASLYQTSQGISDAFRTAHQSMLAIQINLDDVPDVMTSITRAYAKPEDRGSNFLMNLKMKNFVEIVKICTDESEKARAVFDNTLELIRELVQLTTATAGDNEEKVGEAKKLLQTFDEKKKQLDEEKEKLRKRIEDQGALIQKAQENYDKTADKIVNRGFWSEIGRGIGQAIKGVVGIFGGTVTSDGNSDKDALESAKEMYKYQREMEQILFKEDAANRQAMADIASRIINTNQDLLDFKEIIYYLSRGVKILGQVHEQWTRLQNFFASLHTVVVGPMTRNLLSFDSIVKQTDLQESGVLRNELVISGFKAATICISVARASNIYNAVSNKFVLPLIDQSVGNLALSVNAARKEIELIEGKMENITVESHRFIEEKLLEAAQKSKEQITNCRDGFKAALE